MTLGYIGLGIMGNFMAQNLIRAGHALGVWNRTSDKAREVVDLGATLYQSPAEVAKHSDIVFINVTDSADVEEVIFSINGIASAIARGSIVIDHSTISPAVTRNIHERLLQQGVHFLDSPVSGGDIGAKNGTLSIMVGGESPSFEAALPVLRAVGKSITHVGPSGMGQLCKLCNQVALFSTLAGVCEAVVLARAGGLDPAMMMQVVGAGAGASWQLANVGPKVLSEDFAPGFSIDLALKDMKLVEQSITELGLDLYAIAAATDYLRTVQEQGGGKLATPAMIRGI